MFNKAENDIEILNLVRVFLAMNGIINLINNTLDLIQHIWKWITPQKQYLFLVPCSQFEKLLMFTTPYDVMDTQANKKITTSHLLPNEIWLQVLSNLSHGDSLQTKLVCKRWCRLVDELRLKRKSKLMITGKNLKQLYKLTEHQDLKYASVEIDDRGNNSISDIDCGFLIKIFKRIGSYIVELKVYNLSILSELKILLPNLKELNLSQSLSYKSAPMDLNTFSNLKSLSMPMNGDKQQSELLPSLTEVTGMRLEKLCITIKSNIGECLNVLAAHASSLRWLELSLSSRNIDWRWQHQLQETFSKFTQLEVLNLRHVYDSESIRFILKTLSRRNRLKTLILSVFCDYLELILRKWSDSLECLDFVCLNVTPCRARKLKLMSDRLRSLSLNAFGLADLDLLYIITPKVNEKLTALELSSSQLAGDMFCTLVQRVPNLITLNLKKHWSNITDIEMVCIFGHLRHLRHLFLQPCVSENDIKYLCSKPNISNLTELETLQSCLCPLKVIHIINSNIEFKALQKLDIFGCNRTRKLSFPEFVKISEHFPALEKLRIFNLDCGARNEEMRACFPRLRKLKYDRESTSIFLESIVED
ncbi:hypothetical protein GQX74_010470 [Glossina fuscipes]|nr:hypothetical protein GQX74_010470 [Glossina fuscipes]